LPLSFCQEWLIVAIRQQRPCVRRLADEGENDVVAVDVTAECGMGKRLWQGNEIRARRVFVVIFARLPLYRDVLRNLFDIRPGVLQSFSCLTRLLPDDKSEVSLDIPNRPKPKTRRCKIARSHRIEDEAIALYPHALGVKGPAVLQLKNLNDRVD